MLLCILRAFLNQRVLVIQRHLTAAAVLSKQASSFRMLKRRNSSGASTKAFSHEDTESFPELLAIN